MHGLQNAHIGLFEQQKTKLAYVRRQRSSVQEDRQPSLWSEAMDRKAQQKALDQLPKSAAKELA